MGWRRGGLVRVRKRDRQEEGRKVWSEEIGVTICRFFSSLAMYRQASNQFQADRNIFAQQTTAMRSNCSGCVRTTQPMKTTTTTTTITATTSYAYTEHTIGNSSINHFFVCDLFTLLIKLVQAERIASYIPRYIALASRTTTKFKRYAIPAVDRGQRKWLAIIFQLKFSHFMPLRMVWPPLKMMIRYTAYNPLSIFVTSFSHRA